jgi:hypothetical protein
MTILKPPLRSVLVVATVVGWLHAAVVRADTAAPAVPEIAVRTVEFAMVRPPNGGDAWLEAVVELDVRGTPGAGVYARFADRVEVAFALSVRRRDGEFEFFRASAEAVSLEAGPAYFRFYLPPEIVRREQLGTDAAAFAIDLACKGRPLAAGAENVSALLRSPEALRSFRDRVARAAPFNDGVLVPQFESPFASQYGGRTPSFVRRGR